MLGINPKKTYKPTPKDIDDYIGISYESSTLVNCTNYSFSLDFMTMHIPTACNYISWGGSVYVSSYAPSSKYAVTALELSVYYSGDYHLTPEDIVPAWNYQFTINGQTFTGSVPAGNRSHGQEDWIGMGNYGEDAEPIFIIGDGIEQAYSYKITPVSGQLPVTPEPSQFANNGWALGIRSVYGYAVS